MTRLPNASLTTTKPIVDLQLQLSVSIVDGSIGQVYKKSHSNSTIMTTAAQQSSQDNNNNNNQTTSGGLFSQKAVAPLIAGLSGGTVSTVLLLPLDNIKVRLQVNEGNGIGINSSSSSSSSKAKPTTALPTRIGAIRMMRGVIKHEGIRGLYQGLTPAVIGSAGSWGGFFYVYEAMKRQLQDYKSIHYHNNNNNNNETNNNNYKETNKTVQLNSWDNFQVATLSGIVMVFLTNPIWLIKLRMQLQMKKSTQELHATTTVTQYDGFFDAIQKNVRQEGFWALYKGTGPALMLTSHGGVQFVVYEFLRKHFHYAQAQRNNNNNNNDTASVWERLENSMGYLMMGAVSKMVASTVTYPLQVMKSRMQQPTSSVELTTTGDVRVVNRNYYTGIVATVNKIWQQEGISGFFKGAIPNAVRVAPSAAVTFVVYEAVMDQLKS
ncbi:mitochondrial carrier protein [Nitzschia inconspicua]|uniref:Mitochondrial carrier protein n=1 Tax=Nitzschia inconspicua TaxID=303405 RepID=A0A9K3K6N4_9STRA|nr:mitochondrial carrier protein [Nitzschia inconspicua]